MLRPGTRPPWRALLLGLALSSAGLAAAPTAGLAAGGLTASSPPAQAALASAPVTVDLTFAAVPLVDGSHVAVLDGRGEPVNSAAIATGTGHTLRQPVRITAPGDFTVAYHIEFADGGESTGTLRFSVGTGVAPPAPDPVVRRAAESALATHGHEVDPLSATLLLLDGLVGFGVLALLYLRRPAGPAPEPPGSAPPA